ncbi:MAG: TetR/AcrR family transcriptional regulator [Acidimicrobiales bacterium]
MPKAKTTTSGIGRRRELARSEGSEAYAARRTEIARAAAQVFNQRGFGGTSIGAVAKALGMDRATLYYYIGSKEELFDEVVREATEANVATVERIRASGSDAPQKLREIIVALMKSYADNYPLLYVYIRENLNHVSAERSAWSVYMRKLNKRYQDAVVATVQEGMDGGAFRAIGSASVVTYGILGMVGWTNRWFDPDKSSQDADEIATTYAEIILGGLAVTKAKSRQR